MSGPDAILTVEGVSKSFGASRALDSVDLMIGRRQVVGVVGENGAGKSTLLNILSGIVRPDAGAITLNGRRISPGSYAEATALGLSRVFQEQALIPNIKVYENLLLSHEQRFTRYGQVIRSGEMIAVAADLMREAGIAIDVTRRTADLSFSARQLVEIVRACLVPVRILGIAHPVVLLDEPTASLERADEEAFFRLMARMRQIGSLVFVSHRLSEVLATSDVIHVLKDGRLVQTVDPAEADERRLHSFMVGRERDADYYHEGEQQEPAERPVVFEMRDLSRAGLFGDVTLAVREGEVLGIGGLLESGKSELGKGVAGVMPPDRGEVRVGGGRWEMPAIRRLIRQGLGYIPAERNAEGMITAFPVSWNLSLASGGDLFSNRFGLWLSAAETRVTANFIARLGIRARGPALPCWTLSGGNQQKVVLARWLCRSLRVLVLDNPTRGIDAGAKEEIYGLIRRLTAEGVAIILITDELLELIGLSNRIAIMKQGRVAAIVPAPPAAKPTEQELIALMLTSPGGQGTPWTGGIAA
ncbi:MAG: sugar ABC transporter ATP-binding protein [Kiloniellales bacterium]